MVSPTACRLILLAVARYRSISSGDTLLKQSFYTVPTKKWKSACRKALAASPLNPKLFIEVYGVNIDVPKSSFNRKTFSQTVQVDVLH